MEYVHINDEGIRSAANSMRTAAEDMLLAARNMEQSFLAHKNFLHSWLHQFQNALEAHSNFMDDLDEIPF